MPSIIDAILLKPYGLNSYYLILDKMPEFTFERHGKYLIAEEDGFFARYGYESPGPSWSAFGGRKFDIPLKDGTVEHACGQWWWCAPLISANQGPITPVGIATIEKLRQCYVFQSANISTQKLDEWLSAHEASADYYKYAAANFLPLN